MRTVRPADIPQIVTLLIKDSTLVSDWRRFYDALGVDDPRIVQWEMEFRLLSLSLYELFLLILHSWLSQNNENGATLSKLCHSLRTINKLLSAETLEKAISVSNSSTIDIQWPIWFNVGELNENFNGRQKQLEKLHFHSKTNRNINLISGLGGIGKTELTKKFAYELQAKNKPTKTTCTWFNSETTCSLHQSLVSLANENKIETKTDTHEAYNTFELIHHLVSSFRSTKKSGFWLAVFDNVDDLNPDLLACFLLLRQTKNTMIIITSCNRSLAKEDWEFIDLEVWDKKEAVEFIKRLLPSDTKDEIEDESINNLCDRLGNYPLAMQQSVAYIKQQKLNSITGRYYSISNYILEFDEGDKKTRKLLNHKLSKISHPFSKTTYVVWDITIAKVKQTAGEIGKMASSIFNNIVYFDPSNIPVDFIEMTTKIQEWSPSLSLPIHAKQSTKSIQRHYIHKAVKLLKRYSLISVDNSIINIHSLVQKVVRLKLDEMNDDSDILGYLLRTIKSYPSLSISDLTQLRSIWTYSSDKKHLVQCFPDLPALIFKSLNNYGQHSELYTFVRLNYKRLAEVLGKDHVDTLIMQHNYALVLNANGERKKSLKIYMKVWEKKRVFFGEEHQSTLDTAYHIAGVLFDLEKFFDASAVYEKLYKLHKIKGNDDPQMFIAKQNVALSLSKAGELDLALAISRYVLEWRQNKLGEKHPDTLVTKHCIGECHFHLGKYSQAEAIFRDVLYVRRDLFNDENPLTLNSMHMLGLTQSKLGEEKKALKLLNQVWTLRCKVLGSTHPDTIETLNWMKDLNSRQSGCQIT